jgi:glucose/arabinose dehydrogenase
VLPQDIAVAVDGSLLLTESTAGRRLLRIDPATGDRTLVSRWRP